MRIVFLGSGDIAVPSLEWLLATKDIEVPALVTQPDRPAGRGMGMRASHIKELASKRGVEVFQPRKIREPDSVARIASWQPDLIVVMAYGQILPQQLLDVPKLGALNLHASLLPRHRGAAPVHAAILAGDRVTGITSMWMDAGLDTGDMLLQREIEITPEETAGSLHDRLAQLAPIVLEESLRLIRAGNPPRIKQDESLATYAPKLDRSSGRIDWSQSAEEIARRVRGLHPWPGSSVDLLLSGEKIRTVKIHRASAVLGTAAQGEVVDGFRIGCGGGGLLEVVTLQPMGGRKMFAQEFLHGHQVLRVVACRDLQQQRAQQ